MLYLMAFRARWFAKAFSSGSSLKISMFLSLPISSVIASIHSPILASPVRSRAFSSSFMRRAPCCSSAMLYPNGSILAMNMSVVISCRRRMKRRREAVDAFEIIPDNFSPLAIVMSGIGSALPMNLSAE